MRVEHGRLRDDAGFVTYQAMSAFCLIGHVLQGRRDEADRQIRRAYRNGRNALRVFCMLQPTNGNFGPVSEFHPDQPGWSDAASYVVDSCAALGMRVQLNIFADCAPAFDHTLYPDGDSRRRVMRLVADRFRAHPAAWFRLANEAYQNGWRAADDPQLLELADELAGILGHRDFAISDDGLDRGSESGSADQRRVIATLARHCRILVPHPDRSEPEPNRCRTVEHLKAVMEIHRDAAGDAPAIVLDEPRGFASYFEEGRRENRPSVAFAEACCAPILGCGVTYHHIAEQDDATPGLAECATAAMIPCSPDYVFTNANLAGSWMGPVEGWDKVRPSDNERIGYAIGFGDTKGPFHAAPGWSVEVVSALDSGDGSMRIAAALARGERA